MKFDDLRDTWKDGDEVLQGYYVGKLNGKLQRDGDYVIYNADGEAVAFPDRRTLRGGGSSKSIYVIGDIEPYRSVVDGSVIGGRKQHRDHLRAHGCHEVGNEKLTESRADLPDPSRDVADAVYGRSRLSDGERAEIRRAQRF